MLETTSISKSVGKKFTSKLENKIIELAERAAIQATERAYAYADTQRKSMIEQFENQLNSYPKPEPSILFVQLDNKPQVVLQNQAIPQLGQMILNAQLRLNQILIGPTGCGKSFAAKQLAEALSLAYYDLVMTEGASEVYLTGRQLASVFRDSDFCMAYEQGGVFCLEEIDAANPNCLLCINNAIAGNDFANPISGKRIKKHKDFVFIATANTAGRGANELYTGRSRLDASTLNRFACTKIAVNYSKNIEMFLCPDEKLANTFYEIREALSGIKSIEVISTRHFEDGYKLISNGLDKKTFFDSLLLGWSQESVKVVEPIIKAYLAK